MANSLITKDEIIAISFTRKIDIGKIPDKLIESVQNTHIKPILGKTFYDLVVASPSTYSSVIEYLKPVLAYYVKYYILPEIWVDLSTTGINKINGNNRVVGNSEEFNQARQSTLDNVNLHIKLLSDYLDDEYDLYPEYYIHKNPNNQVDVVGGIIFPKRNPSDADDYYITES